METKETVQGLGGELRTTTLANVELTIPPELGEDAKDTRWLWVLPNPPYEVLLGRDAIDVDSSWKISYRKQRKKSWNRAKRVKGKDLMPWWIRKAREKMAVEGTQLLQRQDVMLDRGEIDGWILSRDEDDAFPRDAQVLPDSDDEREIAYEELLEQVPPNLRSRFRESIGRDQFATALDQLDDVGILWDEYVLPLDE